MGSSDGARGSSRAPSFLYEVLTAPRLGAITTRPSARHQLSWRGHATLACVRRRLHRRRPVVPHAQGDGGTDQPLGVELGQRAGLEATVAYAPSNLKLSATGGSSTTSATILTGSGRVFVELVPRSSPVGLQLNGGARLVHGSGTAYQGDPKSTDWGGVVGATVRVRLGQLLHLELHAEDFILGVGLGIPLLGLGGGGGATERPRP